MGAELEAKRQELARKLQWGEVREVSGEVFYYMSRAGYKLEDCRRCGIFVEKIEVPFLDGRKPLKMLPKQFKTWISEIQGSIDKLIEERADKILAQKRGKK